ncbi:hypothetical protein SAMN06265795_10945 [Noviherbaspirillum humi]|uniref:Uncharacterized protein n=1 Tax=Noviherbaspirillum humi TaxID=1688639 RepID=A0A239IDW9_9BURK|nr:hypothetical protein [Noviherbaspirillum humi]SNS91213.1 hypothetical protein SAMN06265795_10945 [Noviherbaspirillum humi]
MPGHNNIASNGTTLPAFPASTWEEQKLDIETFGDWLKINTVDYFILPPVTILGADGRERMVFVLRQADEVVGVFETPRQALHALGRNTRAFSAFRLHSQQQKTRGA